MSINLKLLIHPIISISRSVDTQASSMQLMLFASNIKLTSFVYAILSVNLIALVWLT
jgi:hypothetical protein